MVIKCDDVWREISNYLDGDLDPEQKRAMDEHFSQCRRCVAVRDGMRNVVALYGNERMFTLPAGLPPAATAAGSTIRSKGKEDRRGDGWSAWQPRRRSSCTYSLLRRRTIASRRSLARK